ncbi:MAG: DUF11 domain-containing protein, partial [Verrucomicrobia bacterium]|nr:DUF11 domain-containing protein [Verrucomicrobiota bacterium]
MIKNFYFRLVTRIPINREGGALWPFAVRATKSRFFVSMLVGFLGVSSALAHNLYIDSTEVFFGQDFVSTLTTRASSRQSLIQVGDEFWIVQKGTPGPGTTLGAGGYLTFYIPSGYQVVDAAYVTPSDVDPRGFTEIPIKGAAPISVGPGKASNAALSTTELTGYTYSAANILGVREAPVTSAGVNRGTIAGVYADTGIFYSTDSRTAFTTGLAALSTKAGNSVTPNNLYDSDQERAFGLSQNPILNSGGGGNTPWGMGSAVAGPQSGYAWDFNYATYTNGGSTTTSAKAAVGVGPWNRIQYEGSQISKDIAGNTDVSLGYAGVSAGSFGYALSSNNPLPTNANAVRFSVGQLRLGIAEYVAIKVRTTASFSASNPIRAEVFGGDAAGSDTGKDNVWKYYLPALTSVTPTAYIQKTVGDTLITTNTATFFKITFMNAGTNPLTNVTIKDTLPTGLNYVSATPTPASASNGVITWNLGVVSNNAVQTLQLNVRSTNTLGTLTNTVTASATNNTNLATAYETVTVTNLANLTLDKTVASSTMIPGSTNQYTITISNIGTASNAAPLVVTDTLPTNFTYLSFASADLNGTNYTATNSFISVNATNTAEPVFTINRGILTNQSCILRFNVRTATNSPLGTYYNQAEMTYDGVYTPPVPLAPVSIVSNPVLGWPAISNVVYGTPINTNNALYPTSNVPGTFSFNPTNGAILPVGTNTLVAQFTPSNTSLYNTGSISNTIIVTKAPLVVTCQPTNKVYSTTNPTLTYLVTGYVNGESSNALTTQPSISTTVTTTSPVAVYTNAITASGAVASNYSFQYVPANFTVTPAPSTISVTGLTSFTYNSNTQGPDTNTKTG